MDTPTMPQPNQTGEAAAPVAEGANNYADAVRAYRDADKAAAENETAPTFPTEADVIAGRAGPNV